MTAPLPTYEQAMVDALKNFAIDVGTVTNNAAAGTNALTDSTKMWGAGIHRNRIVKIIAGPGVGQEDYIRGNTANTLAIQGAWTVAVTIGSVYVILNADFEQIMRDVLGGGVNISAANPLPVDTSAGLKTTTQILTLANLVAGATSVIGDCNSLDLRNGPLSLALTVVATYNAAATLGLRVHVRTSPDDANWDSEDWDVWTAGFTAGAVLRETVNYDTDPMYLRVLIENLDAAQAITLIAVIASAGA